MIRLDIVHVDGRTERRLGSIPLPDVSDLTQQRAALRDDRPDCHHCAGTGILLDDDTDTATTCPACNGDQR